EVVGPQHPQVVLDELGALLLDEQRPGAELRILVRLVLLSNGFDRLGLDPRLRGVVHTARQVAVRTGDNAGSEEVWQSHVILRRLRFDLLLDPTPERTGQTCQVPEAGGATVRM